MPTPPLPDHLRDSRSATRHFNHVSCTNLMSRVRNTHSPLSLWRRTNPRFATSSHAPAPRSLCVKVNSTMDCRETGCSAELAYVVVAHPPTESKLTHECRGAYCRALRRSLVRAIDARPRRLRSKEQANRRHAQFPKIPPSFLSKACVQGPFLVVRAI